MSDKDMTGSHVIGFLVLGGIVGWIIGGTAKEIDPAELKIEQTSPTTISIEIPGHSRCNYSRFGADSFYYLN